VRPDLSLHAFCISLTTNDCVSLLLIKFFLRISKKRFYLLTKMGSGRIHPRPFVILGLLASSLFFHVGLFVAVTQTVVLALDTEVECSEGQYYDAVEKECSDCLSVCKLDQTYCCNNCLDTCIRLYFSTKPAVNRGDAAIETLMSSIPSFRSPLSEARLLPSTGSAHKEEEPLLSNYASFANNPLVLGVIFAAVALLMAACFMMVILLLCLKGGLSRRREGTVSETKPLHSVVDVSSSSCDTSRSSSVDSCTTSCLSANGTGIAENNNCKAVMNI
jgi:hypothetical protein